MSKQTKDFGRMIGGLLRLALIILVIVTLWEGVQWYIHWLDQATSAIGG